MANKTNTIWSETEWILSCWTRPTGLLCFSSIISVQLSPCCSSSMIKGAMSSISHADESCFLTLIRALRGLAKGSEEHLHQTLIQQIFFFLSQRVPGWKWTWAQWFSDYIQEYNSRHYAGISLIIHVRQKCALHCGNRMSPLREQKSLFFMYKWHPANMAIRFHHSEPN